MSYRRVRAVLEVSCIALIVALALYVLVGHLCQLLRGSDEPALPVLERAGQRP